MMTDEEVAIAVAKGRFSAIKGRDVEIKGPIALQYFLSIVRMAKSVKVY